jgi:hypothetical protein
VIVETDGIAVEQPREVLRFERHGVEGDRWIAGLACSPEDRGKLIVAIDEERFHAASLA